MKTNSIFDFIILFIVLIVTSCHQKPETIPDLRIGYSWHDHHSALYIAAMNPDFFKKNGGIYLKEVSFQKEYELISNEQRVARILMNSSLGGKELIRKLDEGHFDMAFGGVPSMLKAIDQDNQIKLVMPVMTEGAGFVLRNDLPAANWREFISYLKSIKKQLRIGYKIVFSVQKLIMEEALKAENITYGVNGSDPLAQIDLVNLFGAKNLAPALEHNLIDGFVVNQPYVALAEEQGAGKRIASLSNLPPENQWRGNPCCALAANESYIQSHPEATEVMVTLLLQANQFITHNSTHSIKQIAQWLDNSLQVEQRSIPTIKFTTDFDASWNSGIQYWIETMIINCKLDGRVKEAYQAGKIRELIYNRELYHQAMKNMK